MPSHQLILLCKVEGHFLFTVLIIFLPLLILLYTWFIFFSFYPVYGQFLLSFNFSYASIWLQLNTYHCSLCFVSQPVFLAAFVFQRLSCTAICCVWDFIPLISRLHTMLDMGGLCEPRDQWSSHAHVSHHLTTVHPVIVIEGPNTQVQGSVRAMEGEILMMEKMLQRMQTL